MCGYEGGYRIYNTDPLKENAKEGTHIYILKNKLY